LRSQLRVLEQLRQNLEIQRRAVGIAVDRVDDARETLNKPVPPPLPGQPPQTFGPTATRDLVEALNSLRDAQNNFMSVWLNHYAVRMELMRDLGLMQLDENNLWIDIPLEEAIRARPEDEPLPPEVTDEWMQALFEGEAKSQPQIENGPELPAFHRPSNNPNSEDRTARKPKWKLSNGIPSFLK
ncbi:MAG: hypothetical protein IH899_09005, partial [Planctomycetes bacterium]|nr:hypothetical protein [Planctomycetota bacterium]